MRILFALLTIFATTTAIAKANASRDGSAYSVSVRILEQGFVIAQGSGFFISKNGELITSARLFTPAFSPGHSVEIQNASGIEAKNIQILSCGDTNGTDLCHLKTDLLPNRWLNVKRVALHKGQSINLPLKSKMSRPTKILTVSKEMHGLTGNITEYFSIKSAAAVLNIGQPITSTNGDLLGMTTWRVNTKEGEILALSANEILGFIQKSEKPRSLADWAKQRSIDTKEIAATLFKKHLEKEYDNAMSSQPLDAQQFYYVETVVGDRTYKTAVPKAFAHCERSRDSEFTKTTCIGDNGNEIFTLSYGKMETHTFEKTDGSTPESEPLQIVKELQAQGKWTDIEANLDTRHRKFYYSIPEKIICKKTDDPGAPMILRATTNCRATVYNELLSGGSSFTQISQDEKTGYVMRVGVWISNPDTAGFFFHFPTLSLLSTTYKDAPARLPASTQ